MVKHTQTMLRQSATITIFAKKLHHRLPTNCLSVFDHFVGLALKELIWRSRTIEKKLYNLQPIFDFIFIILFFDELQPFFKRNYKASRKAICNPALNKVNK